MKQIDVRFSDQEMAQLQNMIGKKMLCYKCDPFIGGPSSYALTGIALEDASYAITNLTEAMDFFGVVDDVALFKMEPEPFDQIQSLLQGVTMVERPVNRDISRIDVINERQRLYEAGVLIYEVLLTRGVIFYFEDGQELSVEKAVWFSEDIYVDQGEHLIERFSPTSKFEEGWLDDCVGKCQREIITLQA